MAALGELRKIFTRYIPSPGGVTPESNAWLIIREILLCFLLAILVFHIYANSRYAPFVFDDHQNIANNPYIQISSLDWHSLRRAAFDSPVPTRPVANISFALNYYFDQLAPESFRRINVLIHLGNVLLLLLFLKATLRTKALRDFRPTLNHFMPFAAVAIWVVNPVHTQSVTYIVQRMTVMAAFFYLLAFVLYIYARLSKERRSSRWLLLGGSLLAYFLALGSKENTITLPFFIFLYEWFFFQDLDYGWFKKNYGWLPVILLFWVGMALVYLGFNPVAMTPAIDQPVDFSIYQRLMTQSRVVVFYISLFLFPHPSRLNLDHHFSVSLSPLDPPTTLLAMALIIALFAAAVICRRRRRLLSYCILWYLGNLMIESSVAGLDLVFEHRTYLPSILMSIVIVMFLYDNLKQVWLRRAVLLFFVVVGTMWTHDRNMVWADKITLWEDATNKSPEKARPKASLGACRSESW
jgi:hypothetical protein